MSKDFSVGFSVHSVLILLFSMQFAVDDPMKEQYKYLNSQYTIYVYA